MGSAATLHGGRARVDRGAPITIAAATFADACPAWSPHRRPCHDGRCPSPPPVPHRPPALPIRRLLPAPPSCHGAQRRRFGGDRGGDRRRRPRLCARRAPATRPHGGARRPRAVDTPPLRLHLLCRPAAAAAAAASIRAVGRPPRPPPRRPARRRRGGGGGRRRRRPRGRDGLPPPAAAETTPAPADAGRAAPPPGGGCKNCRGGGTVSCELCSGTGFWRAIANNDANQKYKGVVCPQCEGAGSLVCPVCLGTGEGNVRGLLRRRRVAPGPGRILQTNELEEAA
ncbi:hypothetical protein BU14_0827s0004 [Porphyra umbilicalis]|uniref:CR-type domain-containing protein n=1 Tax=Porphyra umbilicalis TaxID=2786 RepID=A0A1X6NNV8_PORUM|nr:hypothetical protein BU14_0827s0004 [Porphyra umbilicalis]|eukprot:OSX70255.1 hypothetical protein BU14_0827s0004 [Porphyra umbilicalis]